MLPTCTLRSFDSNMQRLKVAYVHTNDFFLRDKCAVANMGGGGGVGGGGACS